ncbi:hypothetical protein A3B60_01415 [Candidatus Peregrinibacteria bacterium RIFCSPLOWO2_01_FULL_39_12]|nr:MAG: hypothetical protein A3B60_01415 [Candidatus Peregrinibacteria bacterium RIFCSPLOWO2_01_FULL_39_12]
MKKILRKFVLFLLKVMAKHRMKKFKGKIIAVTGSVGKTSTKEAIFNVLNTQFRVKRNQKSFNSEFGLLLTILDIESGFSSAAKWSWYLMKGFWHCLTKDYSEILLLELGVDKPGDMDFLTSIVKPDIAVIINISSVHLGEGQFKDMNAVFEEKSKLVHALKPHGRVILNTDNEFLSNMAKKLGKKAVTFGKDRDADYWASQITSSIEGVNFVLHLDNKRYDVKSGVIGEYQAYVILPAIICGVEMGMPIEVTIHAVERFVTPPGRMTVIPAINEAVILDSSYNSSPLALREALNLLKALGEGKRKVAVLGTMNELGKHSKVLHEEIGALIPQCVDLLLTVGTDAAVMAGAAQSCGLEVGQIFKFKNVFEASEFFKDKVQKNDLILVKGSQNNVRLERFVKTLMANPEDAEKLLVRQESVWQNKA